MQEFPKSVTLKDGRSVTLRILGSGDFDKLYAFFQDLPDEDRMFLRSNVTDPELVRGWTEKVNLDRVVPMVADDGDAIVGACSLTMSRHGWSKHVGRIRMVVARSHRDVGMGSLLARELVAIAEDRGLEKLQSNVIEDDRAMVKMFGAMGFAKEAVVREAVKDQHGQKRDLAIMINDVANIERALEDWISDTMIPAYRVPGAGA